MRSLTQLLLVAVLLPGLSFAQQREPIDTSGWTPPPLVDAPDAPQRPPATASGPATPPPPGSSIPPPTTTNIPGTGLGYTGSGGMGYTPGGGMGYTQQQQQPYMPQGVYGMNDMKPPGPEIGLMVSEALFGMLTSAGTALIPYYLLLKPLALASGGSADSGLVNLVFVMTFAAVPLAVSQTELSLANGSRYYFSESWAPALGGLLAQAAVIGAYFLLRPNTIDGGEGVLLIGTVAFVPIAEMIAINLTKQPRFKTSGVASGLVSYSPEDGFHAGMPTPLPILSRGPSGLGAGIGFNLLSGKF
jgi:hypothetical protein